MSTTIEIEILRPVNPAGRSFITYIYGAVMGRDREVVDKYKKEFTRLAQRMGFKLEEVVGTGKLITGTIVLEVDKDKKPVRMYAKDVKVWNIEKEIREQNIEVKLE